MRGLFSSDFIIADEVLRFEWNNPAIFTVNIYVYYYLGLAACRNMV